MLAEDGELRADLESAGVEVVIHPVGVIRRMLATPRGTVAVASAVVHDAFRFGRLIRQRRISLVHSNTSVVLGGAAAAAIGRVPHVWHVREIYSRFGGLWRVYRRVLETASALPCVSPATAAQFPRGERVRVILDGLAVEPARSPREQARSELGLDPDVPVIAIVGRISDWKGQHVLALALTNPALRDRGAIGLIAGEAWPGAEDRVQAILQLKGRLGIGDRVRFLGFRDDVETIYGAADLIAVPSTEPDPLPGSAIEAAAAGCAVVASDHGGLPEIIRDGETGRLVPPDDSHALATVAAELLDHPEERERLGSAAARDVRERFAASRLLEGIQELYDSVLSIA